MHVLKDLRQHLLTGVSYAIPFVACGGILIAVALAFAPKVEGVPLDQSLQQLTPLWARSFLLMLLQIGAAAFTLMLPVLAGYIAYSVAGRPALVAGMVGGWLAGHLGTVALVTRGVTTTRDVSAGFLGAIAAGLIAGYLVALLKRLPAPRYVKPLMPILVIPVISSVAVGALMLLLVGPPIADAMTWMARELRSLQTGSAVVLALVLGAMIAFDMGGPVNKVAFFFASGLIAEGNYTVMGAVAAAICTPPLGLGLATLAGRRLWSTQERESGYAALGMGMIGITEGAIPFAAADPLRVIPCIMLGSMTAAVTAMLGGVGDHAPHGGPIVLPVVDNQVMYVLAIVAGTVVTAAAINALKLMGPRPPAEPGAPALPPPPPPPPPRAA